MTSRQSVIMHLLERQEGCFAEWFWGRASQDKVIGQQAGGFVQVSSLPSG
jgi:hypothetical protein